MSNLDDFDAYQKGYEDAMIAAGQGSASARASTKAKAGPSGRDIGGTVGRGLGTAIGWLVLFPVFMGLMAGSIAWVLGLGFTSWAFGVAGLAFLFALFAGAAIVGWRLFLALWPVVLVVVLVVVIVRSLMG